MNKANPIPAGRLDDVTAEALVAYDLYEDKHDLSLMVGLPATISIGCDSYSAVVTSVTPQSITAKYLRDDAKARTFRVNKHGQWCSDKHFMLTVGVANDRWPLEV